MELGPPDWRKIASIEVKGSIGMLRHVLAARHDGHILQIADESSRGCTGVGVFIDFGVGEHRGAHAARAVMRELVDASARGNIKLFRVLAGDHGLISPARRVRKHGPVQFRTRRRSEPEVAECPIDYFVLDRLPSLQRSAYVFPGSPTLYRSIVARIRGLPGLAAENPSE